MNNYSSGNLRFTALGVLCYSMSLAADTTVYELTTPVDLIEVCQVQILFKRNLQTHCIKCLTDVRIP